MVKYIAFLFQSEMSNCIYYFKTNCYTYLIYIIIVDEKQNIIIVRYAKVYIEMLSLNKREENCNALLMYLVGFYSNL